jgi:hypothetical protein
LTQKASRLLFITTTTVNQWILDAVWRASIQGWENIGSRAIMREKMIFCIQKILALPSGPATAPCQVVATAPKWCPDFSSESIYTGIFYLENHLSLSLNDYCKRKETSQKGK